MKKCIYCRQEIKDESVVDVCERCGIGVWGERMFNAIIENMSKAREKGDLYQGLVNEDLQKSLEKLKTNLKTNSSKDL